MGPGRKSERDLKRVTTAELKQFWKACRRLAANPDGEEPDLAHLEEELNRRNEGLPIHLVREELATLCAKGRGEGR
jgi:hypothetical protein